MSNFPHKYDDSEHAVHTGGADRVSAELVCYSETDKLLMEFGSQLVLQSLGKWCQTVHDSDTAQRVGRIISELAELEW